YAEFLGQRYPASFDDKGRKYLGYIVDGAERMHQLTSDLLRYSRVGRGGLQREEVDTNALVDRVIAMFAAGIHAQPGARITRADLPPVYGVETLLVQLFQNLIGNALKFRREEPPRIRVDVDDGGTEWRFAVHDNGIGIDARHAERVFQLFQRLHERTKYPGTGIGLAITKRIVERHGGRIWVQSTPGVGSCFFFTLAKHKASEVQER
ncbi:MAG TPA: ATP-binding protein, partial [Burkholderiaceae bacterium]|nr:ATP-binding protein [Burkholderiaceae bacterium]